LRNIVEIDRPFLRADRRRREYQKRHKCFDHIHLWGGRSRSTIPTWPCV
jgi:hypothetical protein